MLDVATDQTDPQVAHQRAIARLRRWLHFGNVQAKNSAKPVVVSAVLAELPPEAVEARLDGTVLAGVALDKLERALALQLDCSLPPMPSGLRSMIAGYLPSTGGGAVVSETMLRELDRHYEDEESRLVLLLGTGGMGKTTAAVEWLTARVMRSDIRQPIVFSWSFYRQGYGVSSGQSLAPLFAELAAALAVPITDDMPAPVLADALFQRLVEQPALLLLDGLEVIIDSKCSLPGGVRDPALADLLAQLASAPPPVRSKVVITSRRPLLGTGEFSYPEVAHLKMGKFDMPIPALAAPSDELAVTPLEWRLSMSLSLGQAEAAALLAKLEHNPDDGRVLSLVRILLEALGDGPEKALLFALSLFDRPPSWAELCAVLRASPPVPHLTERWAKLDDEKWLDVLERLQTKRVAQLDEQAQVALHPVVRNCLATEFRLALPVAWCEGQRRLFRYFADQPEEYLPDTLQTLQPLLRACWHGCQAGDYRLAFEQVGLPRINRGISGWILYGMGAYAEGLALLETCSPDHISFPTNCDLPDELRIITLNGIAWVMSYMERHEEAWETNQLALDRQARLDNALAGLPTLSFSLLLDYQHGDFRRSKGTLKQLFFYMAKQPFTEKKLQSQSQFVASAMATTSAAIALVLHRWGKSWRANIVMQIALLFCRRLMNRKIMHIVPGLGGPFHVMLLLDMGRWQDVEIGLIDGDLDVTVKRHQETAAREYAEGRMLSLKSATLQGNARAETAALALALMEAGLQQVTRMHLRWFICLFELALARHHSLHENSAQAAEHAAKCEKTAMKHRFALMVEDARTIQR